MPLVRIHLPQHTPADEVIAISDVIHTAMVATINVPPADKFQTVHRHASGDLICTPEFLGVPHGHQVLMIQITIAQGRSIVMKQALYAAITQGIAASTSFAANDVIINLVEVLRENWSFGNGKAQYAETDAQAVLKAAA
jgi:4-oxalocrotonate tautomerase